MRSFTKLYEVRRILLLETAVKAKMLMACSVLKWRLAWWQQLILPWWARLHYAMKFLAYGGISYIKEKF